MADSVPMTSAIIWRRQVSEVWGRWVRGVLAWHSFTHPHNHSPTRPHNKKKPTGHLVQSLPPQVPPPIPRGPRKVVGADAGAGVGGLHAAHVGTHQLVDGGKVGGARGRAAGDLGREGEGRWAGVRRCGGWWRGDVGGGWRGAAGVGGRPTGAPDAACAAWPTYPTLRGPLTPPNAQPAPPPAAIPGQCRAWARLSAPPRRPLSGRRRVVWPRSTVPCWPTAPRPRRQPGGGGGWAGGRGGGGAGERRALERAWWRQGRRWAHWRAGRSLLRVADGRNNQTTRTDAPSPSHPSQPPPS